MRCTTTLIIIATALSVAGGAPCGWTHDGIRVTPTELQGMKSYGSPLVIHATDFRNTGHNPDGMAHLLGSGSIQGTGEMAWAMAPVYLPDEATISSFHVAVFDGWDGGFAPCDDGLGYNVGVWMMRVNNFTGEAQQMSFVESAGQDSEDQWLYDPSVDYPTIDYPSYSYYLLMKVCHSAHQFHHAMIFYGTP